MLKSFDRVSVETVFKHSEQGQKDHLAWIFGIKRLDDLRLVEASRSGRGQHFKTGPNQRVCGRIMFDQGSNDLEKAFGLEAEPHRGVSVMIYRWIRS